MVATLTRALASPPTEIVVTLARRGVSLVAALSLFAGLIGGWSPVGDSHPRAALVLVFGLIALLALSATGLAVRRPRSLARVDVAVLGLGLVLTAAEQPQLFATVRTYPSDEGRLGQYAIAALRHGHDIYALSWPAVGRFAGSTPLLGGGSVTHFDYPPLSVEIGAGLGWVWGPLGTPAAVAGLALGATAVLVFALLPAEWRALSVPVVLGFGLLSTYAVNGHPALLALALLCLAARKWTGIGSGGQLGRAGVGSAIALGLAAAAQQLAWLVAVAVVLAIWLVRRGELSDRAALGVIARYAGLAALTFVLVDLPFIVVDPAAWSRGLTSVFTQASVPTGQGAVGLTTAVIGHSGRLDFYSDAAALLLVALLVLVAVGFRRLAPLVPLVGVFPFLLSPRSQGEYFVIFLPLLAVWLAGADPGALARSRPVLARRTAGFGPAARAAAGSVLLLPALACLLVAVLSPASLALKVTGYRTDRGALVSVTVDVVNHGGDAIVPRFFLDTSSHINSPWRVVSGTTRLSAGQHRRLTLVPGYLGPAMPAPGLRLWATADSPASITSVALPASATAGEQP